MPPRQLYAEVARLRGDHVERELDGVTALSSEHQWPQRAWPLTVSRNTSKHNDSEEANQLSMQ
eukprot:1253325-Amphidinium_carterae.3